MSPDFQRTPVDPRIFIDPSEIAADTRDGGCFIIPEDMTPITDRFSIKKTAITNRLSEVVRLRDKANQIIRLTQLNYHEGIPPADVVKHYKLAQKCLPLLAVEQKKLKRQLRNFKYQSKDHEKKLANRREAYSLLDADKKQAQSQAKAAFNRKRNCTPEGKVQKHEANQRYRQRKRDKREFERLHNKLLGGAG